jgi:hypothetical protein
MARVPESSVAEEPARHHESILEGLRQVNPENQECRGEGNEAVGRQSLRTPRVNDLLHSWKRQSRLFWSEWEVAPGAARRHMREKWVISHDQAGQVVIRLELPPVGTDQTAGMFHGGQEGTDGLGEPATLALGSQ